MPIARAVLWLASCAAVALLLRSLFIEPVPLWVAGVAFLVYALISTLGVIIPQWEMYADVIAAAAPNSQSVALTFDDGPNPQTTPKVLDVLAERGHKATFFVVGRKARLFPELIQRIAAEGHALGLHGYQHDRLFSLKPPSYVEQDIRRTQDAIEAACGQRPVLFRPPIGYVMPRTAAGAKRAGVVIVVWSARGVDGLGAADPKRVASRIKRGLKAGAIVLLHDAAERDDFVPASIAALPEILDEITRLGLQTRTVPELIEADLTGPTTLGSAAKHG